MITVQGASNVGVENLFFWSGDYGDSGVGDAIYRACQDCWISNVAAIRMTYLGQSSGVSTRPLAASWGTHRDSPR